MAGSMLLINSKGRRRRAGKKRVAKKRSRVRAISTVAKSGKRKLRRAFKRNPIGGRGMIGRVTNVALEAGVGAGGAILTAVVASKIPFPDALRGPVATPLVNGALGIGLGALVGMLGPKARKYGEQMAAGAATVAMFDVMRGMLKDKVPGLGGYGDLLAYENMGGYGDLLAYDNVNGYSNPAATYSPTADQDVGAYDSASEI